MQKTNYLCDRCGEVITSDRPLTRIESGPMRPHRFEVDLCGDSCHLLACWFNEIPALPIPLARSVEAADPRREPGGAVRFRELAGA